MVQIKTDADWQKLARNFLKAEITRRGYKYEDVIMALAEIGVYETYKSFTCKLSRGTFQFTFFLQCMEAIGTSPTTILK